MSSITRLTKKLLSTYPWLHNPLIVSAPMRVMSGPALALAVSRAGGLGFIGPGLKTQNTVDDLKEARSLTQKARQSLSEPPHPKSALNQSLVGDSLPVGVGFQLWSDDLGIAVSAIEAFRPCAAWLFAPRKGQSEIEDWSARIRAAAPGTQIWVQIGTVAEARGLLNSSEKPDVVVVQGSEAGGHGRAKDGVGLMTLLPEVVEVLAGSEIAVFAAGGIVNSRGGKAALALGADGIVMGTRFLASQEARISRGYQEAIIEASDGGVCTTRTLLYNHLRGTYGWPEEYAPRGIINRSFVEFHEGRPFEELKELHDEALKMGDKGWGVEGRLATYAGAGVGLIRDVRSVESIMGEWIEVER